MRKPRKGSTVTYQGMIPYYRRWLKYAGGMAVYFRNAAGQRAARIVVEDRDKAALLVAGKSYTIEQTYL